MKIYFRFVCSFLLASAFAGCACLAAIPGVEHVVVIGCDGFGSLAFSGDHTPTLSGLMREGAYTLKARGVMPTSSSPNWASMIMGAGPEQHGITSNDWETNKFKIAPTATGPGGIFPTIFGVLREQKPDARIACIYDWDGFGRLLERSALNVLENVKGSPATAKRAIEVLQREKPNFLFIHFDDVDHAGHEKGWKSPEYYRAVREVDGLIGGIVAALKEAGLYEKTIVVMTADHGGSGTSHGGESMEELEIPLILRGPGVRHVEIKTFVNTYDLAPTLAWIFGVKPPACWIGKPMLEAFE
jgi:predicted AlkP superfamily pyrophosphatase or phosphodiesterase